MAHNSSNEDCSDDEIFFGKLSLKEIKKSIFMDRHRLYNSSVPTSHELKDESNADSLKLIETHSEPNIFAMDINLPDLKSISSPAFTEDVKKSIDSGITSSDDSFLRLEKMVTELCMSPKEDTNHVLDNTLDVIDYILNNDPAKIHNDDDKIGENPVCEEKVMDTNSNRDLVIKINDQLNIDNISNSSGNNIEIKINEEINEKSNKLCNTNIKPEQKSAKSKETAVSKYLNVKTPSKYVTPLKAKQEHIFKTPKNPLSCQKQSATSIKKTPSKANAYQHITSPIASYIKNCPQVPLIKDVHPRKPLPSKSSIPKPIKHMESKDNKENNMQLPSIAYKSAKKTQLVPTPDKEKLPQGKRIKNLVMLLPKSVVIKHDQRQEISSSKPEKTAPEDSFANLTLHQADLSVCTQKSAFTQPEGPTD